MRILPRGVQNVWKEARWGRERRFISTRAGPFLCVVGGVLLLAISLGSALLPSPLIMPALFLGAGLAGWAIWRPRLLLLLLFACAGLPSVLVAFPGHNMHLLEPALLLLVPALVLARPPLRMRLSHSLALVFLAIAVLSFLHVPALAGSGPYGADKRLLVLCLALTAFFGGSWLAGSAGNISTFLTLVLLVSLPLYGVALAQALGMPVPPLLEVSGARQVAAVQGRLWGTFPWPVNFGCYLINLLAMALACWLDGERRVHRLSGGLLTIITLLAIVGSGTRSALLAAGLIVLLACILTKRFILVSLLCLLAGLLVLLFRESLLTLIAHDAVSINNRFLIWGEALRLIAAHPWLGVGLQQFPRYYELLLVGAGTKLGPLGVHPHQQYLEWGLEGGVLWSVLGMGLLFSLLGSCWRAYKRMPIGQRGLQLAAMLATLANGCIGLVDTPLDPLENAVCFFLLAGLALGQAESGKSIGGGRWSATVGRFWIARTSWWRYKHTRDITGTGENDKEESRPSKHKTGRSILVRLLTWGCALPPVFLANALLARYLGPEDYGLYHLTFPVLTACAVLTGIGMDPLLIRRLSSLPRSMWSDTLSYAAGTRAVSTLFSSGLLVLLVWILPLDPTLRMLCLIGSISLFFSFSFNGLRVIYSHGFSAEQHVGVLMLLEMSNRIVTSVLMILAIWLQWPLVWLYALLIYSDIPLFLVQVRIASKRYGIRLRFSMSRFWQQMIESFPLSGQQALLLLSEYIDLGVLVFLAGPGPVGLYALASRIVDPLISIAFAYVNGFYPYLCTAFHDGPDHFARVFIRALTLLALAIVPLGVCMTVLAGPLVGLMGGEMFQGAGVAVQILMWAMVATFMVQVAERGCLAAGKERFVLGITIISTTSNLLLNILLIPHWQMVGAGIAALFSEILKLVLLLLVLKSYIGLRIILGRVGYVLIGNLPAQIVLSGWGHISLFVLLPLTALLTIIAYYVLRLFTWSDMCWIWTVVRRRGM